MLIYIFKRLIYLLPMMVMMSILAFVLSVSAPGDPVERLLNSSEKSESGATVTRMNRGSEVQKLRHKLGLDLPSFYLSIQTLADIDTLHKVENLNHHSLLKRLARQTGKPAEVMNWYEKIGSTQASLSNLISDTTKKDIKPYKAQLNSALSLFSSILVTSNSSDRQLRMDSVSSILSTIPGVRPIYSTWLNCTKSYQSLYENKVEYKKYVPSIQWYGINNQYHRWLFGADKDSPGAIRGDFGVSYRDGQRISSRLISPIKWSVSLALVSLTLAFLLSIPLGLYAGSYPNSWFDKLSSGTVFGMYAMPSFFVATLLLVFFANPDFNDWLPASGIKDPELFNPEWSLAKRMTHYFPYVILPIISLTYASFAFISRQVRSSTIEAYKSEYVRTAKAKGLSERRVLFNHILPNCLFPLITLFGQLLPMLLGGSIIIEGIFSIPGMGMEIYESVVNQDYPMIVAIFTLMGLLTMVGYLVSDVLYAFADPRVSYNSKKS
jgi:peptide/nickel transport system permease protein